MVKERPVAPPLCPPPPPAAAPGWLPAWLRDLLAPTPAAARAREAWWRHLADLGASGAGGPCEVPRTPGARRQVAG